jgi:hypothetical protein
MIQTFRLLGAAVVNRGRVTRCYRLGHLGATHEEGILGISLLTFGPFFGLFLGKKVKNPFKPFTVLFFQLLCCRGPSFLCIRVLINGTHHRQT